MASQELTGGGECFHASGCALKKKGKGVVGKCLVGEETLHSQKVTKQLLHKKRGKAG